MPGLDSSDFMIAWTRIVAHAAVDTDLRRRVEDDPVGVLADHGFDADDREATMEFVRAQLAPAMEAVERRYQQRSEATEAAGRSEASEAAGRSEEGTGAGPRTGIIATHGSVTEATTTACTFPCWGAPSGAWAQESSARGCAGGTTATTVCAGQPTGSFAPASGGVGTMPLWGGSSYRTGGSAGTTSGRMPQDSFNCWGSAATFGSAGTYCGTAASVGTAGTFGCAGETEQQVGWAYAAGMPRPAAATPGSLSAAGSFGTYATSVRGTMGTYPTVVATAGTAAPGIGSTRLSGGMYGTSGTIEGRMPLDSNCVGSIGTAGSVGCWCGTAGSFGSAGTYGSAGETAPIDPGLARGATLASAATYCGTVGSAGASRATGERSWSGACWGTLASAAW